MSIISFRKSIAELDEAAEQRLRGQQTIARCVQAVSEYALEFNADDATGLRMHLHQLAERTPRLIESPDYDRLAADFRGELRDYRDRFQSGLDHLRTEMNQAIRAMHTMMDSVTQTGGDHERVVRREFANLEKTTESGNLGLIRAAIRHAAETTIKNCEEIRLAREIVIAQLQDEIRNLHRTVDQERRAAQTDPATGVWSRTKLDARIKDLILLNEPFSVFLVGLADLAEATSGDARLAPGCVAALARRMLNLASSNGEAGMVGRWSEEIFAIVYNLPLTGVPLSTKSIETSLGGEYAIQLDGVSHKVRLQAHTRAMERVKDGNQGAFYVRLGQAAFSVIAP